MRQKRSLVGFLDGSSKFLEVCLFEVVELFLVSDGLSLILDMDPVNGQLAFGEVIWSGFIVILHLDFINVGKNLGGTINQELGVFELLVESCDLLVEVFFLEIDGGGGGEGDSPLDQGKEWVKVKLLLTLGVISWVWVICLECRKLSFKSSLVFEDMSVGETMGFHSLEFGKELFWVLKEELDIDVVGVVHVSEDTDEGFKSKAEGLWRSVGEDVVEINKHPLVDVLTVLLSLLSVWSWVFGALFSLGFLLANFFFVLANVGLSFLLLAGVLLEVVEELVLLLSGEVDLSLDFHDKLLGVLGITGLELADFQEIFLSGVTLVLNESHEGFLVHLAELCSHSVPIYNVRIK